MPIRTIFAALLAVAACAWAQPRGPAQGRNGFGPGFSGDPQDARLLGAVAGVPRRVVKNAPYSANTFTEVTQVLADGNRIHHPTSGKVYRDSEGRVRTEQTLAGLGLLAPHQGEQLVVFINDPVAGLSYALNVQDKTATKTVWNRGGRGGGPPGGRDRTTPGRGDAQNGRSGGGPFGRGPNGSGDNVKTESLGRRTMAGLAVDGTRTTFTVPAGAVGNEQPLQIVSEVWYSPDLQATVFSKHWDPREGETVFRLSEISRSEPAASLFAPPPEYQVVDANAAPGNATQKR